MKQTAVDWIIEEINQQQKRYIDLAKKDKSFKKEVDAILTATTLLKMKCNQAKEMEKQQIIYACNQTEFEDIDGMGIHETITKGEQYYNETFKNNESN
jgi:RNA-binding protein YhbY